MDGFKHGKVNFRQIVIIKSRWLVYEIYYKIILLFMYV